MNTFFCSGREALCCNREKQRHLCHHIDDLREATPGLVSPWLHLSHENHAKPGAVASGVLCGVTASPAEPRLEARPRQVSLPPALPWAAGTVQRWTKCPSPSSWLWPGAGRSPSPHEGRPSLSQMNPGWFPRFLLRALWTDRTQPREQRAYEPLVLEARPNGECFTPFRLGYFQSPNKKQMPVWPFDVRWWCPAVLGTEREG